MQSIITQCRHRSNSEFCAEGEEQRVKLLRPQIFRTYKPKHSSSATIEARTPQEPKTLYIKAISSSKLVSCRLRGSTPLHAVALGRVWQPVVRLGLEGLRSRFTLSLVLVPVAWRLDLEIALSCKLWKVDLEIWSRQDCPNCMSFSKQIQSFFQGSLRFPEDFDGDYQENTA